VLATRKHRSGVTLVEVLVAIFIMGIGMLALLVLFPLGALSMAKALKDDRCSSAGANASALAVAWDLRNDPNVQKAFSYAPPDAKPPDLNGLGYPVYVDPYYAIINYNTPPGYTSPRLGWSTGAATTPGAARCMPTYATTSAKAQRWFSLLDDLAFQEDGTPVNNPPQRQGRYTWTYMMRRIGSPSGPVYDLSVVVYSGRSTEKALGETVYPLQLVPTPPAKGDNAVTLNYAGLETPAVRNGTWLLDVSYETNPTNGTGSVHGHFYRVVNTTDLPNSLLLVEVQPPLRVKNVNAMVVMESVAEVLERGTDWKR
jgi:prepilin-type N-terminal cleavage/methylation domain-containing protein